MTSLELVEQINIFRKEDGKSELLHKTLLEIIRDEFEEEISRQEILPSEYTSERGQKYPMFVLTTSQAKQVLVRESKTVRKAVINYIEKLETALQQLQLHSYQIEDPIKRAEKWIEEQKEKQLLLTKTENLETVLDNLLEWVSIIKVAQFNKVNEKAFNWRLLKAKSIELGYVVKKAESPRYGFQNLYHIDCFKVVYPMFNYNFK